MPDDTTVSRFWAWFRANDAKLREMSTEDDPLWDIALAQLQRVNKGLRFEMSDPHKGRRDFVITAQGDKTLFPLVDSMVVAAPRMDDWTIVALNPAKGFDIVVDVEGVKYDPKSIWFLPLDDVRHPPDPQARWSIGNLFPGDFGIRFGVPGLRDEDHDGAAFAAARILEAVLGERERAVAVQYVEIARLPIDPAQDGFIRLLELAAYIATHRRRIAVSLRQPLKGEMT
jgi:hypothetical protein